MAVLQPCRDWHSPLREARIRFQVCRSQPVCDALASPVDYLL